MKIPCSQIRLPVKPSDQGPALDFRLKCNITLQIEPLPNMLNLLKNERAGPAECNRTDILLHLLAGLTWAVMTTRHDLSGCGDELWSLFRGPTYS